MDALDYLLICLAAYFLQTRRSFKRFLLKCLLLFLCLYAVNVLLNTQYVKILFNTVPLFYY